VNARKSEPNHAVAAPLVNVGIDIMYVRDKTKLANIMKRHFVAEMQEIVDADRKGIEDWLKEYDIWGKSLAQLKQMQEADAPNCKTCKGKGTVRKKWGRGFRNVECPNWSCEDGKVEDNDLNDTLEYIIDSGSIQEWMKSGEGYVIMDYQDMVYLRDKIREGNYYKAEAGTHLDTLVRESIPYDVYAVLTQLGSWCENDIAQRNPQHRAATIAYAAYLAAHQKYISIMGERGWEDKQIRMYDGLSDAAAEKANNSWEECEVMHRTISALNNCRICGPVASVVNNPKLWSDSVFWNIYETLKEHNRPRSQVVRDFKAVLNEYDWSGTELGFNAESFAAESWGGDPDGQLAQALEQARSQPRSSTPVSITELPKICAECGADSPQAFGLFDESDRMISEAWFCDSSCADKNLGATQISFGADEKKNPQVKCTECPNGHIRDIPIQPTTMGKRVMCDTCRAVFIIGRPVYHDVGPQMQFDADEKKVLQVKCPNCFGYLTDIPRYERVRNKPLICDNCNARFELCNPNELQRLKNRNQKYPFFRSESEDLTSEMVITDNDLLPDPVSWIIWLADPPRNPRREYDSDYAELFFVRGPGQRVRMEDYRRTAEVNGVYGAPFMVTQNADEPGWLDSEVTIRNFTDASGARSLSVGDIVEDSETGTMWIVAPVGYYQLEPTTEQFSAPLARHPLKRFQPRKSNRKSASYWRKRGKDAIFRPKRTE
jgi:hypothetical protein